MTPVNVRVVVTKPRKLEPGAAQAGLGWDGSRRGLGAQPQLAGYLTADDVRVGPSRPAQPVKTPGQKKTQRKARHSSGDDEDGLTHSSRSTGKSASFSGQETIKCSFFPLYRHRLADGVFNNSQTS